MNKGKNKILFVDDDQIQLLLLTDILTQNNFTVISNSTPQDAFKVLDISFDCIILDLLMPNMNGYDFIKEMRKKKELENIPILVLTAVQRIDAINRIFDLGANDFLSKPYMQEELIARINFHIKLKNTTEDLFQKNEKLNNELKKNQDLYNYSKNFALYLENTFPEFTEKIDDSEIIFNINKLVEENKKFKIELESMNLLYNTIIEHDEITEEEMEDHIKKATQKSNTDFLTKINNRNKFSEDLDKYIDTSKKSASGFSLIMFDIDHFKAVNDNFGHDVGDMVLTKVTDIVSLLIRKDVVFARWGGEEFMILLPNINIKESINTAERLRKVIEKTDINFVGRITCSFGVAEFNNISDNKESILKRVDNALYNSKSSGRNCVKFA